MGLPTNQPGLETHAPISWQLPSKNGSTAEAVEPF